MLITHQKQQADDHSIEARNRQDLKEADIVLDKLLEVVPVALEVVEPVHDRRESGNRVTLKGVKEESKHHLSTRFLLHLGLKRKFL